MATPDFSIQFLSGRFEESLLHRFGRGIPERVRARLDHELSLLTRNGHDSAFQSAVEVVRHLSDERINFLLVGAGPCSILNLLLGLTELDPLKHQLPAERFLSCRNLTFSLIVDPHYAQSVQNLAEEHSRFESSFRIHSATYVEIVPEVVVRLIRRKYDPDFGLWRIPLTDSLTVESLATGNFEGVIHPVSEEIQQAFRQFKPRSMNEVAACLTAHQIGVSQASDFEEFLQRASKRQNTTDWSFQTHNLLAETHGLLLYQEQTMLILHRVSKIPFAEGYLFIQQAAKRKIDSDLRSRFVRKSMENHLSMKAAEDLIGELESKAGYTVCKAHQLTTALVIWRSAYLMAHFPHEFHQAIELLEGRSQ